MLRPVLLLICLAAPAAAETVRFTERMKVEDRRYSVPMMVELTALSRTQVGLTLTADLGVLQADLPALLSQEDLKACGESLATEVRDVRAKGETLVLEGRVRAVVTACGNGAQEEVLRQTAGVRAVLGGRVVEGCLRMRTRSLELTPEGLTGGLLSLTGLTGELERRATEALDRSLLRDPPCIELPAEFRALGTEITGGGFRDLGDGRIGAVLTAELTVDAAGFIRLMKVLEQKGDLGD